MAQPRRAARFTADTTARSDAVVIEVGEYWLPRVGFGFVRDLLKAYDALDAARAAGNAS